MSLHFTTPLILVLYPVVLAYLVWVRRRGYVRFPAWRHRAQLILRALVLALLVLALSRPFAARRARVVSNVYLIDVSRSVSDRWLDAAGAWVRARAAEPDRVVTFAGHPRHVPLARLGSRLERHDQETTDIAQAVAFARGLAPGEGVRIALLSDGWDSDPQVVGRVHSLLGASAELEVVRLRESEPTDARVVDVLLPELLRRDESANATLVVKSTRAGSARLRFDENGLLLLERALTLTAGSQSFDVPFVPTLSGMVSYAAQITLADDEFPENDRFVRIAPVSGPMHVLLAARTPEEGRPLERALEAQDIRVEAVSPAALPLTVEGLLSYEVVLLCGVAPMDLDTLRQLALASYVRNTGGGLVDIAGRAGLRRDPDGRPSALEPLLPLELTLPSERNEPPVALVLLIDRSGSMVGEKLQFAKQAALAAIDKLSPHDQVGVIAFDAKYEWILPMRPVEDKDAIRAAIGTLGAGGGTRFFPALEEAYFVLASTEATVRHAILLTDGVSTDPDVFAELLSKARASGVTVSSVAIGHGADTALLTRIAKLGQGRYSLATHASEVPNIFVRETETVQRDAAQRKDTKLRVRATARALAGIDFAQAPPLAGYVRTRAKPGAETLLDSPSGDPVLARWRNGLGEVLVFGSDATAAWGQRWLTWPEFGRFWAQLVRGAQRPRMHHDLNLSLALDRTRLHLTVQGVDADGRLLDEYTIGAQVIDGAHNTHEVSLPQTGPGRYETDLEVPPGTVLARPNGERAGRRLDGDWVVLARPYSDELREIGANPALLDALSRLSPPAAAGAGVTLDESRDLTAPLMLLAVVLFLCDLASKRAHWEGRR